MGFSSVQTAMRLLLSSITFLDISKSQTLKRGVFGSTSSRRTIRSCGTSRRDSWIRKRSMRDKRAFEPESGAKQRLTSRGTATLGPSRTTRDVGSCSGWSHVLKRGEFPFQHEVEFRFNRLRRIELTSYQWTPAMHQQVRERPDGPYSGDVRYMCQRV